MLEIAGERAFPGTFVLVSVIEVVSALEKLATVEAHCRRISVQICRFQGCAHVVENCAPAPTLGREKESTMQLADVELEKEHTSSSNGTGEVGPVLTEKASKTGVLVSEVRTMIAGLLEAIDKDNTPRDTSHDGQQVYSRNTLKAFSGSTSVSLEKFIGSGGLRSVIVATSKHANSGDAVDFGCRSLTGISILCPTSIHDMVHAGVIEAITSALQKQCHEDHPSAANSALKLLRIFTQTEDHRRTILDLHGMEAIIEVMRSKPGDARGSSHAALVLSNLAFGSTSVKDEVGLRGGVAAISNAMRLHIKDQAMQARGALALRNLSYKSESNQAIAGENGSISALVNAIETYPEDRETIHQACTALVNLTNTNEANRTHLSEAGGVKAIAKIMRLYPKSATVSDDCISILRNISVGNEIAQTQIGQGNCIGDVIQAMVMFRKDEKLVEKACAAIRYACFVKENRETVGDGNGIQAIVDVIKIHSKNASIVENAFLALGNATFELLKNKTAVGTCGGIEIVKAAIEDHRHNENIQIHGCRLLRNLADNHSRNQSLLVENEAINTAVFALIGFPDSAAVQEQALAFLLNLAMNEDNLQKLRGSEAERLAEKAIQLHAKHRGVLLQGGQLIDKLNGVGRPRLARFSTARTESGTRFGRKSLARRK